MSRSMLSWSSSAYKLTLGVGSLAIAGLLSELWHNGLPIWAVLAISLLPVVVFVFVHPGELPTRIVRFAHVVASVWYIVVAVGLVVALAMSTPLPKGWPIYPLFLSVGAIPCVLVLVRTVRGRYDMAVEPESDSPGR